MSTFSEHIQQLVDEAARIARIPGDILAEMKRPRRVIEKEIPLVRGDGSQEMISAWRVQHNNALGPYKGGVRFHPASNLDEVKALAALMTWKTSLMGLPYGGAKGAIRVDSRAFSAAELERVSREYVKAFYDHLGPQADIPAPDVGTNARVMDWMADEYAKITGHWEPAAFTGKSIEKGGSKGREQATGLGGYIILKEFFTSHAPRSTFNDPPIVAIQGFGNVGSHIAHVLFKNGFKIVAVSDSHGAVYETDGIDIDKLAGIKERTGMIDQSKCYAVTGHGRACTIMTNDDLLMLPVDILIPAALEHVITKDNAARIKARVILELANGPVTKEADDILTSCGIEVIPDILANGGGVVGSYYEWVQSLARDYWPEQKVFQNIEKGMIDAFRAVKEVQGTYGVTWRQACYIRALTRVADAMKK